MMSPRRRAMSPLKKFLLLFILCLVVLICLVVTGYILVTQLPSNISIKTKEMQLKDAIQAFNEQGFTVHLSNDQKMYTFVKNQNQTSYTAAKLMLECFCKPKQMTQED